MKEENKRNRLLGFCIFPGYNWCGPGCSGPDDPANDVDAVVKLMMNALRKIRNVIAIESFFIVSGQKLNLLVKKEESHYLCIFI